MAPTVISSSPGLSNITAWETVRTDQTKGWCENPCPEKPHLDISNENSLISSLLIPESNTFIFIIGPLSFRRTGNLRFDAEV